MLSNIEPENEEDAYNDLYKSLASHARYKYRYREYLCSKIMRMLCCCCKGRDCYKRRVKRLQRHEVAQD